MKFLLSLGALALVAAQNETEVHEDLDHGLHCFVATSEDGAHEKFCIGADGTVGVGTLADDYTHPADTDIGQIHTDMDTMWIILCGALVFFMQAGFGVLEAGCISDKNVINIMFKNVMDASIAGICYWLLGYGLAYGAQDGSVEDNGFIGMGNFGLTSEPGNAGFHNFFFQWAFAATAATIVAGSVAERCKLEAYFVYSIVLTVVIYPIVSHWIWDTEGWLSAGNAMPLFADPTLDDPRTGIGGVNGMVDFAGCAVVHMVGGWAGLVAAYLIGPREDRFTKGAPQPHNLLFCGMGVLFLWFGWYGFNCGSTLGVSGGSAAIASRVATTTTIAAASGCVTAATLGRIMDGNYDLLFALNGILAGLVSITASCCCVEPWGACCIGIIGTFIYKAASMLLIKLKIDDPLDAAPVHGFCGLWGALCPGIWSSDALLLESYGNDNDAFSSGRQFLTQLVGVASVLAWVVVTSFILFYVIKITIGLRVDIETERVGLDCSEHGGKAYSYIDQSGNERKPAEAVELTSPDAQA